MLPPLMTMPEASKYLRIHPSTMFRLVKAKLIPAFRIGTDWRFRKDLIDQWIDEQTEIERRTHRG